MSASHPTEREQAALIIRLLRRPIEQYRYAMAPRLTPLRTILAKLEQPEPLRPLPPASALPSHGHYRRRGCTQVHR